MCLQEGGLGFSSKRVTSLCYVWTCYCPVDKSIPSFHFPNTFSMDLLQWGIDEGKFIESFHSVHYWSKHIAQKSSFCSTFLHRKFTELQFWHKHPWKCSFDPDIKVVWWEAGLWLGFRMFYCEFKSRPNAHKPQGSRTQALLQWPLGHVGHLEQTLTASAPPPPSDFLGLGTALVAGA